MSTDERATPRQGDWRWPRDPEWLQSAHDRAAALTEARAARLSDAVSDNDDRRRAVITSPDDDASRHAYAAWMRRGAGLSSLPRRRQP